MTTQALRDIRTTVPVDALTQFQASLQGRLIQSRDTDYDEARAVYNCMIDKRPSLIVQSTDVADVIGTVDFAREQGMDLAIRGGGHNGPSLGTVEGGIVLDLSPMKGIRVDPIARTARVEGAVPGERLTTRPMPSGLQHQTASSRPRGSVASRSGVASVISAVNMASRSTACSPQTLF